MAATEASTQIALLHQISNIVNSGVSLEKMLQELISLALDVTDCDACLVYLLDRNTNEIVLRASQQPHAQEIGNIRMKMGEGITGWVAEHRSVVALSSNASADARFKRFQALPEDTYEAFLSVPLIGDGELIGVINVHHRARHYHTPEEIAMVSFIGEQMGGAFTKAWLEQSSAGATRRMEALAGLARTIAEQNYLDNILQSISEMVAEIFDAPVCSIMLVDEDRRELVISAARCSSPDYLHKMPLRIEDSLIGRVVREARPIVVPHVLEEKQYRYPELARRAGLASLLSAPLIAREKVIGTINIYTRDMHHFSDDEVGFVKVVAGQAAIAAENARLMSEALEMKRTLEVRKLVERAKGILQHKHSLTEEEAYLRLRNESRRLRRPMRDLAEAVILADDLEKQKNARAGGDARPGHPAPIPSSHTAASGAAN
ncbi:MAG TPA: GAF domain-containing protein [Verrucomicrobiae bacterium]|nr:GAF domain-containing protein [Verrucomicrobiae bacterium]